MLKLLTVEQEHQANQFNGTEVTYHEQNAVDVISRCFANADRIDSCGDYNDSLPMV
jgi:hypothetical protein